MNLFEKINYSIKEFDPERLKGRHHISYGNPPRPQISYYFIKDPEYFKTLSSNPICKIPADYVFFSEIIGEGLLLPHRDHNVSCCVNLYFEPNGSTTFFHKEKENIDAFVYPGKSTANIYDLRQVNTVGKFIAKKNDCYLLNVSEIHSVLSPNPGARRMLTWQWTDTPYEEVLKNIIQ